MYITFDFFSEFPSSDVEFHAINIKCYLHDHKIVRSLKPDEVVYYHKMMYVAINFLVYFIPELQDLKVCLR